MGTQFSRLVCLRSFFKWLTRNNYILYNPASELDLPKKEQRLPKYVLTAQEAEKVFSQVDLSYPMGLRNRAILETFYSTGIRRVELINLNLHDLDIERGTLIVRHGKGRKDRIVPIGERAILWIEKYLRELRCLLAAEPDEGFLFISKQGNKLTRRYLSEIAGKYIKAADINKKGCCHIFRHTMATLMLEGGADIRYVQEMLGHESLRTTQIYTKVAISKLKEIHSKTHPGANLKRKNNS